jgi:hypothetical protein
MTDLDLQSDITINYHDDDLLVAIPLVGQVTEMRCRRYAALARAKDVPAMVRPNRDGPALLHLTVPPKTNASDVQAMLDVARTLIAEADAADQSPASSASPETVARMVESPADLTARRSGRPGPPRL